jgi:hypothetical protein
LSFCVAKTHGSIAAGVLPARLRRKAASLPFFSISRIPVYIIGSIGEILKTGNFPQNRDAPGTRRALRKKRKKISRRLKQIGGENH